MWKLQPPAPRAVGDKVIGHHRQSREAVPAQHFGDHEIETITHHRQRPAVQSRGWPLTVVSDGLDFVITEVLRRHGLAALPVVANHLVADGARRWRLEFPHARPRCVSRSGNCKCAQVPVSPDALRRKVLMIGDGVSDFCVAERCDLSFARKRLLEHCLDNGLRHNAVADFRQALALLPTLDSIHLTPGPYLHDKPD